VIVSVSRVMIIGGGPGSGKSWLGRQLSDLLGLPIYSIDEAVWDGNGNLRLEKTIDKLVLEQISNDRWIIEGGNAIALSASSDEIRRAVRAMFTDPNHLRVEDPGSIEGNVVFTYLDAFDQDQDGLVELKAHYQRGGLGDGKIKARLESILQELIAPIRTRRAQLAEDRGYVLDVIRAGTDRARARTEATKRDVVSALGLFQL
jgi:hypothetical protein